MTEYLSRLPPETQERIERGAQEIAEKQTRLSQLRTAAGLSQKAMADQFSAMRAYAQALGGDLEVTVSFPNGRRYQIATLADLEQVEAAAG